MHGFCCPVKGAPHPLTPHSHGKRVGDTALTGKVSHDGGRGGCGSRSGRRSGRVGVAGDGPVSEPGERGTDGSGRRHHHRPRSALSAAVCPYPPPRRCARGPHVRGRRARGQTRTRRGPTARWSQDQAWSPPQDKGVGPSWSHRADFTRQTRDQRGTIALVLAPRVVPWKRLVWSHSIGLVVPQHRPDGATPARPVAPQ